MKSVRKKGEVHRKKILSEQDILFKELMDHDSFEENDSSCDVELYKNMYKALLADKRKRKAKAEAARKRAENDKIFKSKSTVENKLQDLLPQSAEENDFDRKRVAKWEEIAKAYMIDMKKEANSNQLAVAIAATLQFG